MLHPLSFNNKNFFKKSLVSSRTYRPRYIGWFRGLIGYVQKLIKKEAKHVIYIWKAEILVIRTM